MAAWKVSLSVTLVLLISYNVKSLPHSNPELCSSFPKTSDTIKYEDKEAIDNNIVPVDANKSKSSKEDLVTITTSQRQGFSTGNQRNADSSSEGKRLSRFYRQGQYGRSSTDAIVFPAASDTDSIQNYNRPFADRYNKHRPNIPTPQRPIPFNFAYGLPAPPPFNVNTQAQGADLLTPEQNEILQQTLAQLFRRFFNISPQTSYANTEKAYRKTLRNYGSSSTTISPTDDGVNYQSLYSGPRVPKSPCPNGYLKSHSGSCHEKPRKLMGSG